MQGTGRSLRYWPERQLQPSRSTPSLNGIEHFLLPFPTAVIADAIESGHPADVRAAVVIGDLVAPPVALAGFFVVAVFYGLTSHGVTSLPAVRRR